MNTRNPRKNQRRAGTKKGAQETDATHSGRREHPAYPMPRAVAMEVRDLLEDVEGEADEDLLDEATQILRRPPQFDGTVRARLRAGEWVMVELTAGERATLLECIVDWNAGPNPARVQAVARRFVTALRHPPRPR